MSRFRWANSEKTAIAYAEAGRIVIDQGKILRAALAGRINVGPMGTPDPDRAGMSLTMAQLLMGLVARGWITLAEGQAWARGTALPQAAQDVIATLPEADQFPAEVRLLRMTRAERLDPLVAALAASEGVAETDLDTFFTEYATA